MSSQEQSPIKRSKSHKRKHRDASSSAALAEDLQQSPTKKAKRLVTATTDDLEKVESKDGIQNHETTSQSPFFTTSVSLYLAVSPITLRKPLQGLCAEHLSPLLLTYYPPLNGIILSYSNPRLSESPETPSAPGSEGNPIVALSVAEYGVCYVWITVDFLLLSPHAGTQIEGFVNVQSETHLGLVCWNLFNATISSDRLPKDWRWVAGATSSARRKSRKEKLKDATAVDGDATNDADAETAKIEDEGHWVNQDGEKIEGTIDFNVVMIDADGGGHEGNYVSIVGTMLDEQQEAELVQREQDEWQRRHARKRRTEKKDEFMMSGAAQGEETEESPKKSSKSLASRGKKHRSNYG